jgi:hypothetical protein
MAQRLSDWFTNLAETRTRTRAAENASTTPTEPNQPLPHLEQPASASNAEPNSGLNTAESDSPEETEPNSDEIFNDAGRVGVDESAKTRFFLFFSL